MRLIYIVPACLFLLAAAGCTSEHYGAGVDSSVPSVKVKDIIIDASLAGRGYTATAG